MVPLDEQMVRMPLRDVLISAGMNPDEWELISTHSGDDHQWELAYHG
jgi:hypothetical protein